MTSKNKPDLIDFGNAMKMTPEDIEMLWRVKQRDYMDPERYLQFLLAFTERHPPSRETSEGWEPFEL